MGLSRKLKKLIGLTKIFPVCCVRTHKSFSSLEYSRLESSCSDLLAEAVFWVGVKNSQLKTFQKVVWFNDLLGMLEHNKSHNGELECVCQDFKFVNVRLLNSRLHSSRWIVIVLSICHKTFQGQTDDLVSSLQHSLIYWTILVHSYLFIHYPLS